jgi:hypothetical protein
VLAIAGTLRSPGYPAELSECVDRGATVLRKWPKIVRMVDGYDEGPETDRQIFITRPNAVFTGWVYGSGYLSRQYIRKQQVDNAVATALYLYGMRAIIRGKHAKAGALQGLDNDLTHNWVIFHDEDGFKCILFRTSYRFSP